MYRRLADVREFQRHFYFPAPDIETTPDKKDVDLWLKLCREEFGELWLGLEDDDLVEICDGLADLEWVLLGYVSLYGVRVLPFGDLQPFGTSVNVIARRLLNLHLESEQVASAVGPVVALILIELHYLADCYGVDMDPIWAEVRRTNMAKTGGAKRADGKLLKPEGWEPPRIRECLEEQGLL
jgi:predicted HAD superfamily Cof-like phosphohydrolase